MKGEQQKTEYYGREGGGPKSKSEKNKENCCASHLTKKGTKGEREKGLEVEFPGNSCVEKRRRGKEGGEVDTY